MLWRREGALCGDLTDVVGIHTPLSQFGRSLRRAVIVGSGGAARAATVALEELGCTVSIVCRNIEKGRGVLGVRRNPKSGAVYALTGNPDKLAALLSEADVVIQATPVGGSGESIAGPCSPGHTIGPHPAGGWSFP